MEYEFPQELVAEVDTRAGRMFSAGDIRVTVTDVREGGQHVTVRFKAILDNREGEGRNWLRVPLNEATHVFIEVPNASGEWPDKIGVFYPRTGTFFEDKNADPVRVNAAILAARWLNEGEYRKSRIGKMRLQEETYCGVCGRTLTDPESIDRGIGPECYGKQTESVHQVKQGRQLSLVDQRDSDDGDWRWDATSVLDVIDTMTEDEVEKVRLELNSRIGSDDIDGLFER